MIDRENIAGFRMPGSSRRLVRLEDIFKFVANNDKFRYVLDKIEPLES